MVHHGIMFLLISHAVNLRNNKLNIMERIVQNNPLRYLTKELEEDNLRIIIGQRISWKNKDKMWLESADSMHI